MEDGSSTSHTPIGSIDMHSPTPIVVGSPGMQSPTPDEFPMMNSPTVDGISPIETTLKELDDANETNTKAGRTRAAIWDEYEEAKLVGGKLKVQCKQCKKLMLGDPIQGTSHLKKHFQRCRSRQFIDMRQRVLTTNFSKDKFELSPYNFDQEISRNEMAKMIIQHEYPLKMVEHDGFKNFVKSLNPCYKMVTRNTIKKDCLKVYGNLKEVVLRVLELNESRVAITTDMWTSSHQKRGFMAITAHYVDNNWKLQSRIIRFIYVPSPHTSEVLCEALIGCLLDWNLDGKLSTITVDNCTTNDKMMNLITAKLPSDSLMCGGKLVHMRCAAHILNLVVQDGLKVIGNAIEKVRESVAYWTATPKRMEKFEETARQLRVTLGKKLTLDCKTRWNSTYLMLQIALDYKDVFARLSVRDSKYDSLPTENDWHLTKEICGRLSLFYKATELFSGTEYPTANLYFPKICEIKLALNAWVGCGIDVVESMAREMLAKFNNYWSVVHGIMGVATVLDPRYKYVMLEYYFPQIYGTSGEYEVEEILDMCREFLRQYEAKEKGGGCRDTSGLVDPNISNDPSLSGYDLYASTRKRKSTKSELDTYLDDDVLPRTPNFDVLNWWKSNATKYPTLHKIARDVLAIPVSTVASESAFSTSGRLISPHRSRLHHKTIEALMCAQNWILSDQGNASFGENATVFYDSDDEEI